MITNDIEISDGLKPPTSDGKFDQQVMGFHHPI
jgi:hypothetical protein